MTFLTFKQQVNHLIDSGRPFGEIETWIDCTPLADEEQCALWLFAWSLTDLAPVKREASVSNSIFRSAMRCRSSAIPRARWSILMDSSPGVTAGGRIAAAHTHPKVSAERGPELSWNA